MDHLKALICTIVVIVCLSLLAILVVVCIANPPGAFVVGIAVLVGILYASVYKILKRDKQ